MVKKLITSLTLVALLFSLQALSFAQSSSESSVKGNLSVLVSDPSGAVIQGAKLTLAGPVGEKTATTDQDGKFLFSVLIPGYYSLKISKEGFKSAEVKSAEVVTGRTSVLNLKLELGTSSTVVEVSAASIAVDTTSTAVSANLTDTFYQGVPVARGVASLFYASVGVTGGGGTGQANPSISGSAGLENSYVADGVNITDGGFGGIGVFSRNYGSLATGINLSFVKEVQVKTGGFEAQYGKSTGGIVQIVTKTGSNQYHGSIGFFAAPRGFERDRLHPDDADRFNLFGKRLHQADYDLDAQIGGYVPGFKEHLFFFGDFNPTRNFAYDQFAQFNAAADASGNPVSLGNATEAQNVYSYAGKLTLRASDKHQFEASIFGDPTRTNVGPNVSLSIANRTGDNKLKYGTRNVVGRYNGTLSPTWLVNVSGSWGHNGLRDSPASPDVYQVQDLLQRSPGAATRRGLFFRQGYGFGENTVGNNYGFNLDTSKIVRFWGEHSIGLGYQYARSHYDGNRFRTGARAAIPFTNVFDDSADDIYGADNVAALTGGSNDWAFQLRREGPGCTACPLLNVPALGGDVPVYAVNTRGEFGVPDFKTQGTTHTAFLQDAWSPSKYVTINAGIRWEQQRVAGTTAGYTFTGNYSPRFGVSVDPWGDRKTKIYANFGRYFEAMPLDIAIRSLSNEKDLTGLSFAPEADITNHVIVGPGGTINIIPDAAHFIYDPTLADPTDPTTCGANGGTCAFTPGISASAVPIGPGTKMQYLDEFVVGFEHEFKNSGVIFSARYLDRRIKRIVEDMAALSPEAFNAGLAQNYFISNPTKAQDLFTNPIQIDFASADGVPAECAPGAGGHSTQVTDSNGDVVVLPNGADSVCVVGGPYANGHGPGDPFPDGVSDGFVDPKRIYKAVEFEVNKSFSKNWQMRANWRVARLRGNYEGTFRNDNGQSDPNISSLFDFTRGDFNLLANQFDVGLLNTDTEHLVNGYFSYVFSSGPVKGLTLGTAAHFQTGTPISDFLAHPAYFNAGEIPSGGRGSLGRTPSWGNVDLKAEYAWRITEKGRLHFGVDMFNITNMRHNLRVDQNRQRTVGAPNADFLKPLGVGTPISQPGYQRPFYARIMVKYEF
jgi:hypothetical protein